MKRLSQQQSQQGGFTLLEVVLAISLAGALLAAATAFIVSVSNIWVERQDRHFFEDHVDGVSEFIQAAFSNAGLEIGGGSNSSDGNNNETETGNETETVRIETGESETTRRNRSQSNDSGSSLLRLAEAPVSWAKPPGFADYQDPLLSFSLKDTPPLLVNTEDGPIIGVICYLHFESNEGLSLLWYTPLQEDSEDIDDLRRSPISPYITEIRYVYWDESFEKWEESTEPEEGEGEEQFLLPRFLKLTFEYEGETKERTLTIPVPSQTALVF